jgi:hypothetical protein
MTEQQREDDLLAELLELPESDDPASAIAAGSSAHFDAMPMLTRSEEQALLNEAHQVGTPTLTPTAEAHDNRSFAADIARIVRRHPLPAVLAGVGLVMLLARRRRYRFQRGRT